MADDLLKFDSKEEEEACYDEEEYDDSEDEEEDEDEYDYYGVDEEEEEVKEKPVCDKCLFLVKEKGNFITRILNFFFALGMHGTDYNKAKRKEQYRCSKAPYDIIEEIDPITGDITKKSYCKDREMIVYDDYKCSPCYINNKDADCADYQRKIK